MEQNNNDMTLMQGFNAVVRDARNQQELKLMIAAEQIIIAYCFDMMKAIMVKAVTKAEKLELPDQEPMRNAVTEINRACVNQQKECLFTGDITRPLDLFTFAAAITVPDIENRVQ